MRQQRTATQQTLKLRARFPPATLPAPRPSRSPLVGPPHASRGSTWTDRAAQGCICGSQGTAERCTSLVRRWARAGASLGHALGRGDGGAPQQVQIPERITTAWDLTKLRYGMTFLFASVRSSSSMDCSSCNETRAATVRVSGVWVFRGTRMPVVAMFENLENGVSCRIPGSTKVCDPVTCHHGSD
jgi:hypothetical protein